MYNKVAVIGDKDTVLAFKAVGVEVFAATDAVRAAAVLKKLSEEQYAVVFVTEEVALLIPEALEKAKSKPFPAVVPIPVSSNFKGLGMKGIKKDVEKAIGTDILFNKEDKI